MPPASRVGKEANNEKCRLSGVGLLCFSLFWETNWWDEGQALPAWHDIYLSSLWNWSNVSCKISNFFPLLKWTQPLQKTQVLGYGGALCCFTLCPPSRARWSDVDSVGSTQGTGFSCLPSTFLYITNQNANHPKPLPGLKLKLYNYLHPEEPDQISKDISFSAQCPASSKSPPTPQNRDSGKSARLGECLPACGSFLSLTWANCCGSAGFPTSPRQDGATSPPVRLSTS